MAKSNTKKKSKKKTTSYNKKKKKTTVSNNKKKNSKTVNNKSKTVKNNKNNKKIKNINESNKKFTQVDSKINNSKKIIEKETNDINTAEPQVIKESTVNITELKNQTLPKNTEKKQEIIKDIKNNNKLKDLIAKIKNKVKKISKQNNKSLDDEISDEKITINKKMLTIVTMILIVITIIYIPLMLILRDKKDTASFKKISIDKYIELYDKKEMNYVFVTTNKCTYCDLLRTKLSKLQNEYKIEILELNVGNLSEKDKEKLRGDEICLIPQSVNFLDPLMKISNQVIGEVKDKEDEKRKRINQRKIFEKYGLDKSVDSMYPFQLSGGMVRKVLLSTALLSNPDLIVADEPTPGLDTKDVEETIENIRKMKEENKGVLLITHEIDVALKTADRIAIFYSGYVIEINDTKNFLSPSTLLHPYTKSLIKALPRNGFILTKGIQPLEDVKGCVYYENCPCKMNICKNIKPILIKYNNAKIRCHLYNREV